MPHLSKFFLISQCTMIEVIIMLSVFTTSPFALERKKINLPSPKPTAQSDLLYLLKQRRSIRAFKSEALSEQEVAQLLFAAQGVSDTRTGFRTAPSAGATYPLETYLMNDQGIWHYLPHQHALELVKQGDFREKLAAAALGQTALVQAPVVIIFTAIYDRTTHRYHERGK